MCENVERRHALAAKYHKVFPLERLNIDSLLGPDHTRGKRTNLRASIR